MIVSISGWKLPTCSERPPSPCGRSGGSGSKSTTSRVPSGSFSRSTSRLRARTARAGSLVSDSGRVCRCARSVLAVRELRADRGVELDRYYLSNLGSQEQAVFNDRQLDPDLVPRVTARCFRNCASLSAAVCPSSPAATFTSSIRDEELPDIVALNRALLPYIETLFRLAARGHWMREKRPVISLREPLIVTEVDYASDGSGISADVYSGSAMATCHCRFQCKTRVLRIRWVHIPKSESSRRCWNRSRSIATGTETTSTALADQENPDRATSDFIFIAIGITSPSNSRHEEWQGLKSVFAQAAANSEAAKEVRRAFSPLRRTLAVVWERLKRNERGWRYEQLKTNQH